jgi:hypothetical protein
MKISKFPIKISLCSFGFIGLFVLNTCSPPSREGKLASENHTPVSNYTVAAYIWPSCHDEPRSREVLWPQGIGEWEIIQQGTPRFKGHYQPRLPLWGYEMDDDPKAMEKKINAAVDHGVNVFIFDWYWYDGEPFLESSLDNGFLKAGNHDQMKFYLMWANHDVPGNMWNHYRYKNDSLIWTGDVDWENFKIIVDRVIKKYFNQPNYFKVNDEPVFSIFSIQNLVRSFKGLEGTKKAIDYFREEVKAAGFPGLHIQQVGWGNRGNPQLLGDQFNEGMGINQWVDELGINSVTTYSWVGSGIEEDYLKWGENAFSLQNKWDSLLNIPYIPIVSVGWDNTPRYPLLGMESVVHINNTPESFAAYLQKTRNFIEERPNQPRWIILNAWNEWVEGSYLEPDMKWGYGYLEAVKKIMCGEWEEEKK